eukprot:TRINITY_DN74457_c0_g1_i1.p1 TRINITY_DN74457_c0_g1~~TRINITY_DN74457_c0_g1_i1.p1  ORF type:complete len:126 (+),score=1.98 TRINITY_DN74457_c0_g1_i1:257-634(+)
MIVGVVRDLMKAFVEIITSEKYQEDYKSKKNIFETKLKALNALMGESNKYLLSELTWADFYFNFAYHNFQEAFKKLNFDIDFSQYPNLNRQYENYRKIESLQKVIEEEDKKPFYPPSMVKAPILS